MDIAFYGSSLLSSYWNGAATYYRGLLQALSLHGHRIVFYEPDAFDRQAHRDIEPPPWAHVVVYEASQEGVQGAVAQGIGADVVIKASGVGVFDDELLCGLLEKKSKHSAFIYWDVDAPATLSDLMQGRAEILRQILVHLDLVLTYGGGAPVIEAYLAAGARRCVAIYNALDPASHHPVPNDPALSSDLTFLGNRLPDREARVEEFFLAPAQRMASHLFVLGGSGWADKTVPINVKLIGHVPTASHNTLNCSALAVLNVARDSMAKTGFSPATRVFEAAGAGACVITDSWEGIEMFFAIDHEILVARDGADVIAHLQQLDHGRARAIGAAARARCLKDHTYTKRAAEVDVLLRAEVRRVRGIAA